MIIIVIALDTVIITIILVMIIIIIIQHFVFRNLIGSIYHTFLVPAGLDSLSMHDWQTTDIVVRIKETHDDSGLIDQTGVIRGVSVSTTHSTPCSNFCCIFTFIC